MEMAGFVSVDREAVLCRIEEARKKIFYIRDRVRARKLLDNARIIYEDRRFSIFGWRPFEVSWDDAVRISDLRLPKPRNMWILRGSYESLTEVAIAMTEFGDEAKEFLISTDVLVKLAAIEARDAEDVSEWCDDEMLWDAMTLGVA